MSIVKFLIGIYFLLEHFLDEKYLSNALRNALKVHSPYRNGRYLIQDLTD